MSKDQVTTVSDAVYKLQLALLDGIQDENQLFAAGSLMSKNDYNDIVTERTISKLCGYPLCPNAMPLERPRKGHYKISLKEHKVYDLHETYMYCSSRCLINSRAFGGSLQDERCSVANLGKIDEILGLFKNLGLEDENEADMGENGDLGISKLKIEERSDVKGVEVPMEEWIGPSNAIEGYVPQRDRKAKPLLLKGSEPETQNNLVQKSVDFKVDVVDPSKASTNEKNSRTNQSKTSTSLFNEMDFMSAIITNDEYTVSKDVDSNAEKEGSKPRKSGSKKGKDPIFNDMDFMSTIITQDEYNISNPASSQPLSGTNQLHQSLALASNSHQTIVDADSSVVPVKDEPCAGQAVEASHATVKSSLKSSKSQRTVRSVSWADDNNKGPNGGNLCEVREFGNTKDCPPFTVTPKEAGDDNDSERFASAEACAMALTQAAEAIASGQSDISDAVSEAGIILLPKPQQDGEDLVEDDSLKDSTSKWPTKPGYSDSDFDSNDSSWFDTAPEGFTLTLSPFATMWNALFSWMTSSSLAYIYGRDESLHEEYLFVNGREYPVKAVLPDGRSTEIKQTLAGCLARALPGVITILKLPTPVSTLEQGLVCLINTMSFMEALPPFRLKQWQVIVLLFIDALSICRIPGLTPYLTSRRILIPKVLDGAQITTDEFEIMRELVIPLGRVPQFSMQSGG